MFISTQNRLKAYLLLNGSFNDNIGLLDGKSSILLYLNLILSEEENHITFSFLEEILMQISPSTDGSYARGLSGVGVVLDFLAQKGCFENDLESFFLDCEIIIENTLTERPNDFSLSYGVSGVGMYYLAILKSKNHSRKKKARDILQKCVDRISRLNFELCDDTSILTGVGGLLLFLNNFENSTFQVSKVHSLLTNLKHFVRSKLCNDLELSSVELWLVFVYCEQGKIENRIRDNLKSFMSNILCELQKRRDFIDFKDEALLALWMQLIYFYTGIEAAGEACTLLTKKTLNTIVKNDFPNIFAYDIEENSVPLGLNNGISRIALPLLSLDGRNFEWLSILGINITKA